MKTYNVEQSALIEYLARKRISHILQILGFSSFSFAVGLIIQAFFSCEIGSVAQAILVIGLLFSLSIGCVCLYLGKKVPGKLTLKG